MTLGGPKAREGGKECNSKSFAWMRRRKRGRWQPHSRLSGSGAVQHAALKVLSKRGQIRTSIRRSSRRVGGGSVRLAKRGLLTDDPTQAFTFCPPAIDLCMFGAFLGVWQDRGAHPMCLRVRNAVRVGTGPALTHFHLGTALVPRRRKIDEKSTRRKMPRAWLSRALLAGAAAAVCECVCGLDPHPLLPNVPRPAAPYKEPQA